MTLAELFTAMRAHAFVDPMARAHQDLSGHREVIDYRSGRWTVILTINR